MTTRGGGGNDKPPPPDLREDPLPSPASEASSTPSTAASSTPSAPASSTPSAPASSTPSATPPGVTGASSSAAAEEPLLPATYHENDLRSAVGASPVSEPAPGATRKSRAPVIDPRDDDDDDDDDELSRPRRNRKAIVVAAFSVVGGLVIAGLVFLGHVNSDRYLLACEAERAVPEQGRAFPPWGTRALEGEAWKPLKIAPETRCQPHETDDPLVLERLYLAMILDQVTGMLTAREVTRLDEAEALLEQALLLTRPPEQEPEKLASERNERHEEIERMLGDVTYWRAVARLHDAATALADAAKQFDSAAAQHPRHVSDASGWAAYARKLAQELHTGPVGAMPSTSPLASPGSPATSGPSASSGTSAALGSSGAPPGALSGGSPAAPATERPSAPAGVALPVEPGKGSAEAPPPSPAPPDAGVPTGGVLL